MENRIILWLDSFTEFYVFSFAVSVIRKHIHINLCLFLKHIFKALGR
jgi:hypothetical protein